MAGAGCDSWPELCCTAEGSTCHEPTAVEGEACGWDHECERGLTCFDGSCRPPAAPGEGCDGPAACGEGLGCSCDSAGCVGVCHELGTLALDEPCARDESCVSGVCNMGADSVCTMASGVDGPCLKPSDCAPGLVCNWGRHPHVCREPELAGAPCERAEACAEGHVCEWNEDNTEKRCVERAVGVGDTCVLDECGHELVCDELHRKCAEPVGAGEPCRGVDCRAPLTCNYGLTTPRCVELGSSDVGEPCSADEHCVPGSWCGAEICRTEGFRGSNEPCRSDRECAGTLRCQYASR